MNVDSILISEYARSFEGGRLVIVGTLRQAFVPGFPATLPPLYVTLVLEEHKSRVGSEHELEIRVLDADRKPIGQEAAKPIKFRFSKTPPPPGVHLRHNVIAQMHVTFPREGPFAFEVYIDGTYHASAVFYVGLERAK